MDFGDRSGTDGINEYIDNAEVFSIFFPKLGESIVIDLRHEPGDAPLVKVMPMVRSASERVRTIRRLRPRYPRPSNIVAVPWLGYVGTVRASGLWGRIRGRLEAAGSATALRAADSAVHEVEMMERQDLARLIRGDRCETLWTRPT